MLSSRSRHTRYLGSFGCAAETLGNGAPGALFTREDPHEEHLDEEGVDGEEICPAVLLGACHGVACSGTHAVLVGAVGKKNIFE